MLLKNICLFSCVFVVVLLAQDAEGQTCTRRTAEIVSSIQPYTSTYLEQYKARCWYGACTKTRVRVKVDRRTVTARKWVTQSFCCEGYIRDETKSNLLSCKPVCIPSCTNGYCESPGQCACNDGYESTDEPHHCSPICEDGCKNGICTAPETCSCNFGYILAIDKTCQPICTEPCINGTCTSPDTCECKNGYRKSESNKCEPYCSRGCSNGSCIEPEVCVCNEGYQRVDGQCIPHCDYCGNGKCVAPNTCECQPRFTFQNGTCLPVCSPPCENGSCDAPDICTCNHGYELSGDHWRCEPKCSECGNGTCVAPNTCKCHPGHSIQNGTCLPVCTPPCENGSCDAPDICTCNHGYNLNSEHRCEPTCFECGRGTCIAPGTCECDPGYETNETRAINFDEPICAPVCRNCEGTCVKPNLCICDSEYDARNETADGKDCNCFDNCTDDMNTCDRTVCLSIVRTTPRNSVSSTTMIELESSTNTKLYSREEFGDFYDYTSALDDNKLDENRVKNNSMNDIGDATSNDTLKNNTNENKTGNYTRNKDENNNGIPLLWICIAVAILTIFIILALVLVLKRNEVAHFFGKGSYAVKDKTADVCASTTSIDTRFSTIAKSVREYN